MTLSIKTPQLLAALFLLAGTTATAQEPAPKPEEKSAEKSAASEKTPEKPTLPFQIQLLETRVRFEANGDSRKEVHTVVKLNNILGAREFARLAFDYNRGWQQVEIPMVRVTHANGGTSEVLPSAITDAPNSAVEKFPAYHDVRVKSVRILGLQEGDTVEYRVITTTTHAPLAPNFWLEHTFDRSGQVLDEKYEVDVPDQPTPFLFVSPTSQSFGKTTSGDGTATRVTYSWKHSADGPSSEKRKKAPIWGGNLQFLINLQTEGDIVFSTYTSWAELAKSLRQVLSKDAALAPEIKTRAQSVTENARTSREKLALLYDFVAQKVVTVDLPLNAMQFTSRQPKEILAAGYASPEDKALLLIALAGAVGLHVEPVLTSAKAIGLPTGPAVKNTNAPLSSSGATHPSLFTNILVVSSIGQKSIWMDPSEGVVPFGMIAANLRGKTALLPLAGGNTHILETVPQDLPFAAFQKVGVSATLGEDGKLVTKVNYTLRGDNELLPRMAFHQTPKERWKDVAGLLAISDGFRGQVTSVNASDPMATKEPFTVEYAIAQPKFVDWTKKPVRIPALLPQIAVPDLPAKPTPGAAAPNIELGTPLNVETSLTMRLPPGTTVQTPVGTTVTRDYATFSAKYSATGNTLSASRHINFIAREIPADRSTDYNAFLHAIQGDQAQFFTLVPAGQQENRK